MKRVYIIPIAIFIIFVFIVYFVLPAYNDMSGIQQDIKSKQEEIEKTRARLATVVDLNEELVKHTEALDKVFTALPNDSSIPSLFNLIQSKAEASGLILQNISPSQGGGTADETASARINETFVSITVVGDYSSFENFLMALEQSSRLIEIETIGLSEAQEELPEFNILIKTHSY